MHEGRLLLGGACVPIGMAIGGLLACRAQQPVAPVAEPRFEAESRAPRAVLDHSELVALGRTEDQILSTFEAAFRRWQESPDDPKLGEEKCLREEEYRTFLKLSDEAVERYFTPERIAAVPWTDLLAGDQARNWIASDVEGFEYRIENGVLHMLGPAPHVSGEAILSIGDREQWRDLVLDIEFTLISGECTLWMRLPRVFQENVATLVLSPEGGLYTFGVNHELVIRLIGSSRIEEDIGEDFLGPFESPVSWTQVRKGALGISIPRGSEVHFTRLRAKILR